MNRYVDYFLSLKCAGDVLNVVNPITRPEKEISESMGAIRKFKGVVLNNPMEYTLWDFCAGNALTSVLGVHLLPLKRAIAIDKKERHRRWHLAKRFDYLIGDIYDFTGNNKRLLGGLNIGKKSIILGVHACGKLSEQIIEIYNNSDAERLVLNPCCSDSSKYKTIPSAIRDKITKYEQWCWYLYEKCKGEKDFWRDKNILSPKNIIIKAKKE